jgi:hypothetical protein
MAMFWWIPALIPLIGALILLFSPVWPIAKWEGVRSLAEATHNWKKFGIYFVVNTIACVLLALLSWYGATGKMRFKEVWNSALRARSECGSMILCEISTSPLGPSKELWIGEPHVSMAVDGVTIDIFHTCSISRYMTQS